MSGIEEFESMIWHLVHRHFQSNLNREELMQEARVAAFTAIAKYDASKKASLRTFVFQCVRNHILNLTHPKLKDAVEIVPLDEVMMNELEGTAYNTIEDVEFNLTMKKLLNKLEYEVYFKCFVEDKGLKTVSSELEVSFRRAHQCYQSILQKFSSLAENQHKILTRRELQNKWLAASPA